MIQHLHQSLFQLGMSKCVITKGIRLLAVLCQIRVLYKNFLTLYLILDHLRKGFVHAVYHDTVISRLTQCFEYCSNVLLFSIFFITYSTYSFSYQFAILVLCFVSYFLVVAMYVHMIM